MLLLSHCGLSFMEDLIQIVTDLGGEPFVLSSQPVPGNELRIEVLSNLVQSIRFVNAHALTLHDVKNEISRLQSQGKMIHACISVWEGYRGLMAEANALLGVADELSSNINLLTDKFALRRQLKTLGLSQVNTELLTPELLETYQEKNVAKFIKPCRGLASYGAFRLNPNTSWEQIAGIQNKMMQDKEYQSIFSDQCTFVAEDYIPGIEFSFEVICLTGKPNILAIHEKVEVSETNGTTLENACVSPVVSLSHSEIKAATKWINTLFEKLHLHWGCFHLEARYHNKNWEVIEINPRVGGAYISKSVEIVTNENSLLELWVESLYFQNTSHWNAFKKKLQRLNSESPVFHEREHGSFFRVYFSEQKGTIKDIHIDTTLALKPYASRIFLKKGDVISCTEKEVFAGQILWKLSQSDFQESYAALLHQSAEMVRIDYV